MPSSAVDLIRARFPALSATALSSGGGGRPPVFLDNPGGTQVPQAVVDAMSDCFLRKSQRKSSVISPIEAAADEDDGLRNLP